MGKSARKSLNRQDLPTRPPLPLAELLRGCLQELVVEIGMTALQVLLEEERTATVMRRRGALAVEPPPKVNSAWSTATVHPRGRPDDCDGDHAAAASIDGSAAQRGDVAALFPHEVDVEMFEHPRAIGRISARPKLRDGMTAIRDLVSSDEHVVVADIGVVDDGASRYVGK